MNASKKFTAAIVIALLAVVAVSAGEAEELTGSDVARQGTLTTLSGTLLSESGEWYLVVGTTRYEIHLGQLGDKADTVLKSGSTVTVSAFAMDIHLAPVVIDMGGVKFTVWNPDRRPSWAGMGNRRYGK